MSVSTSITYDDPNVRDMPGKIVHLVYNTPPIRLELNSDDIELAKMEIWGLNLQGPADTRWLKVVLQFRDAGATFAEAASIVYLARRQLKSGPAHH